MALKLKAKLLVSSSLIACQSLNMLAESSCRHVRWRWFFLSELHENLRKFHSFSSGLNRQRLCWEGSSNVVLLGKLENALKEHKVDEAWVTFDDFRRLYGLPKSSVVGKLITELSYSSNPRWLQKAYDLAILILKKNPSFVQPDVFSKVALSLARAQMPVQVSVIIRLLLERGKLPPLNVFCLLFLYMVKTDVGTCIASNLLIQICEFFMHLRLEKKERAMLLKPDTLMFNLVLDGCVRFGLSLKGQLIMELMAEIGVVADAHSIVMFAQINEMNGQRDEMKKLKGYIDHVSAPFLSHYLKFYDSLLALHFKFDDIDAAAGLLLDMLRCREPLPDGIPNRSSQKHFLVPIGSQNIRNGLKIRIAPELIQKDSFLKAECKSELVTFSDGKVLPNDRALGKLINGYKKQQNISKLSNFLVTLKQEFPSSLRDGVYSDVIKTCISLGWLETAHDILDDMELAGIRMDCGTCMTLLAAYYNNKMSKEGSALLKQMRKAGFSLGSSSGINNSSCISELADSYSQNLSELLSVSQPVLLESLAQDVNEGQKLIPATVYELNSSIYFFCKAKMLGDALKTYRHIQESGILPTVHTFAHLVHGYSSSKMFRDITFLWGDIKRYIHGRSLAVTSDLYEFFLLNFLRGGYFERVMEVIGYMEASSMYVDRSMYKSEFLKLHRNLYRNLKASEALSDVQRQRLGHVQAFRKWAGI